MSTGYQFTQNPSNFKLTHYPFVSAACIEIRALPGGLFTRTGFQRGLTGFAMLL
jgi:hypothetical protein